MQCAPPAFASLQRLRLFGLTLTLCKACKLLRLSGITPWAFIAHAYACLCLQSLERFHQRMERGIPSPPPRSLECFLPPLHSLERLSPAWESSLLQFSLSSFQILLGKASSFPPSRPGKAPSLPPPPLSLHPLTSPSPPPSPLPSPQNLERFRPFPPRSRPFRATSILLSLSPSFTI